MKRMVGDCLRTTSLRVGLTCLTAIAIAVSLLAGAAFREQVGKRTSSNATSRDDAPFDPAAACEEVVCKHNELRAAANQPVLSVSTKLQDAAARHAKDMAAREAMTHKGGDGSTPLQRIKAAGYPYRRAGENIAAGRFTINRLMKGWMDSPHHKKNILGSYSQIGVACATGQSGKRYWCVTFGLPIRH